MSNVVVTELVVDARGAEAGTAAYARAMKVAQDAIDRAIDREEKMRVAQEKATVAMTGGATSVARVASQWQRLAAASDPVIAASQKIAAAQMRADAAVRRGVTTHEEASRVIAAYSDKLTGAAQAARDMAMSQEAAAQDAARYASRIDQLRASFDPAYASAKRMSEEVDNLARLESAGIAIAGGYAAALDRIIVKYDESSQAAARAAEAQKRFIEQARAEQAEATARAVATDGQDMWNRYAGVRPAASGSARASASAFEEDERELMKAWGAAAAEASRIQAEAAQKAARAEAELVEQAKRLRAELDPSAAAFDTLNAELARYQALADAGKIETRELAAAQALAVKRYEETEKSLKPVVEGARLAGHQVQNLTFQLNDAVTMLLSGSSFFQVAATQGGQVVQALGDHPGGVRGSISAMKDGMVDAAGSALGMAAAFGPLKIAAAAAGIALVGYAAITWLKLEPLDDLIDAQAKRIAALKDAYGIASEGADDYARRSGAALARESEKEVKSDRQRLMNEASIAAGPMVVWERASQKGRVQYDDLARAARDFRATVDANDPAKAFVELDRALEAIAGSKAPKVFRDMAAEHADLIASSVILAKGIQAETLAMDAATIAAVKMGQAYRTAMSGMSALIPDLRTDAERINALFGDMMRNSTRAGDEMVAQFMRQKAMSPITAEAQKLLDGERASGAAIGLGEQAKAVAEVNTRYAELTAQYKGNTDALIILEQWRDQAIANAGKQTAFDADQEAAKKAETAAKQATAEAERYADATRSRMSLIDQTVASLRMEAEALGQSEGAAAASRFEFQALAAAKQAAASAGKVVSDEEIASIRQAAGEVGTLTDQIAKMREAKAQAERLKGFMGDLDFDVSISGLPEVEQEIQRAYRDLGVTAESADGQKIASNIRYLDSLENTKDGLIDMRDVAKDVVSTLIDGFGEGGDVMEGLLSIAGRITQQFAEIGLDKLFDGALGTGQKKPGIAGTIGAVGQAAGGIASQAQQVQSAPLAALNDSLGKSAKSALDVARQFEGLNERADSKVLDGFLRASGNWKGMSAQDTAWCAAFANASIVSAGGQGTGSNLASSFLNWGQSTNAPKVGDIVVLRPQSSGASGHVGFLAGFKDGRVQLFGGNQGNSANVSSFGIDQVVDYRTGTGLGAGDMARAVEVGTVNATRKVASGSVPGVDPGSSWGAQFSGVANVSPMISGSAAGGGGMLGGIQSFMKSPFGMGAMNAIGGFATGMQSGDPIGGGLTGALGALGMGLGPVGIIAGGVAGLLGGLFGKSKQKKEAKRQAQMQADQAWTQNYPQLLAFSDEVNRVERGALSQRISDMAQTLDQFQKLADATNSGANKARVDMLRRDMESFVDFLTEGFRDSFGAVSDELAGGLGINGPFSKAREAILSQADAAHGFVEDTRKAFEYDTSGADKARAAYEAEIARLNQAREKAAAALQGEERSVFGLPGGNLVAQVPEDAAAIAKAAADRDAAIAAYEASIGEAVRRYDEAVAKAVAAAREGLLRVVSGDVVEQSDIEKALAEARGAAAGLDVALKDLGMSAEEAATAIEGALAKRMDRLRETFSRGLQDEIDDLDGKGYLASFRDLIEQRDSLLKDASLINVDTSLVSTFFGKQAQAIVDGADLTAAAFDELVTLFPELAGVVRRFSVDLDAIKSRIEGYDDRRFAATSDTSTLAGALADFERRAARERQAERDAGGEGLLALGAAQAAEKVALIQGLLIRARQDEVSEIESTISRLEGLRDEWKDLRASLKLDDTLSPLSQRDQFLEAQKEFRDVRAKALAGDEDAQAKLAGISQSYLEEARGFYASSEDYYAVFNEVQGTLESAQTTADQALTAARSQLDIAKAQLDAMTGVKDGVAALNEALTAALAAMASATAAATGKPVTDAGIAAGGGASFVPRNELEHFLGVQYGAILGRAPDASGVSYYTQLREKGATADDIIAMIKASPEAQGRGFSSGGFTGWGGTGEVAGAVHGQEFVMRADATRAIGVPALDVMNRTGRLPRMDIAAIAPPRHAGNDNGVAAAELVAELRLLRTEMKAELARLRGVTAAGAVENAKATREGNAVQQTMAVEQKVRASGR